MTVRLLILAGLFVAATGYVRASSRPEDVPARTDLSQFPSRVEEWVGSAAPDFDNDVLEILGVDDYLTRIYRQGAGRDRAEVGLYVGYHTSQRQGDTIHSPMNCLPGAGWQPIDAATVSISFRGTRADVNRVVIQKGEMHQVALYWYQGRGRIVANEYRSRALLVWDAATRHRTDGALVRVISPVLPGEAVAAAERRAVAFAEVLADPLARFLPE